MKKILAIVLTVLMLCALSVSVFAAETNYVFHDVVGGNDANDGLTLGTPKKGWGASDGSGTTSVLLTFGEEGATLVIAAKTRPTNYSLPALNGPLTITAVYDGVDYKNPAPAENPASGVWKQAGGATFTFNSDVTFTDIITFQENPSQEIIQISNGATLTIDDSVVIMKKPDLEFYQKIIIDEGATAKLSEEALKLFTIENHGTLLDLDGNPATVPTTGVELKMTLGKTDYTLNGETKTMDVAPIIRNSRTMLPVRYVAEALGAEIAWDGATSTATLKTADTEIKITVGAATATVNGQSVTLDSPAFLENDRTYMPVRFVAETLGGTVAWDGATSTATITK